MANDMNTMSIKELDAKWAAASDSEKPAIAKVIEQKLEAGEKPQGEKNDMKKGFSKDINKALDVLGL